MESVSSQIQTIGNKSEEGLEARTAWELVFIGLELFLEFADCGGILVTENLIIKLGQPYFQSWLSGSTHSPIGRLEAPEPLICMLKFVRRQRRPVDLPHSLPKLLMLVFQDQD